MDSTVELAGLKARIKELSGTKLTAREVKALDRWRRSVSEDLRDSLLHSIPKGIYCRLADSQQKVVDEFADQYDIPIDGPTIDLYQAIAAMHDRISEFAKIARRSIDGDEAELVKEKLRQEIGKLQRQCASLQINIDLNNGQIVAKKDVKAGLDWLTGQLRIFGSQLHRDFGTAASDAFNVFLTGLEHELENGTLRF